MLRFLSLAKPQEYAFAVYEDGLELWRVKSHDPLCTWAGFYPTYGDSIVQHGTEMPVQREQLSDFLGSLAAHLHNHPDDVSLVAKHWPNYLTSVPDILFLHNVRYKEGKTQYYSESERKVSSAASKRHDKRWEQVPDLADGSVKAVCTLLDLRHQDLLFVFATYQRVSETLRNYADSGWFNLPEQLRLREQPYVETAFDAVDCLVQAYRLRQRAQNCLESYQHNLQMARERSARKQQTEGAA